MGYEQVWTSGQYYRSRYLSGSSQIRGISEDTVKLSQIAVTAPVDNVLQNSAVGFLQGLYPPQQTVQTLANGQNVQAPMDGYQLIPVNTIATGGGSEDSGWLQDASTCQDAKTSSNNFFSSKEYQDTSSSTKDFYSQLVPSINNVISADQVNFKNGYIVFDILNIAEIHNSSIPNSDVLTNDTLFQVRTLADKHEFGLAYNQSDNARAAQGMQLAGEILKYFNNTISSKGANKFGIQFGAYATFLSFFGLTDLTAANEDFYGVPDYASSMVFELFTNADVSGGFPTNTDDLQVRFLFHNGTASNSSEPTAFPLFGGSSNEISYSDFKTKMGEFAVTSTEQWCGLCGSSSGVCAAYGNNATSNSNDQNKSNGGGMSLAVAGVIGAMVTLAVLLGTAALVLLLGGFRVVSKKRLASALPVSAEPKA